MLHFDNWILRSDGRPIAQQEDHLLEIEITGSLPAGWTWQVLVEADHGGLDKLDAQLTGRGLRFTLTEKHLGGYGYYTLQMVGTCGKRVRHSSRASVYVEKSLSGNAKWPTIPTAFTEMERRMADMSTHPPIPGEDGNWMLWDTAAGKYVASDIPLPEGTGEGGGGTPNAVQYVPQALTEAQQTQARQNIGAFGEPELQGGIDQALEQAQESGAFKGDPGAPGKDGKDGLPTVAAVPGAEVSLTMESNVEYHCAEAVTALTIEGFTPATDGKSSIWAVQFAAGESITVELPDTVKWSVAEPVFVAGVSYWLSFVPLVSGNVLGVWIADE